ncbi:hypothetical protein M758_1G017600 [Ceratodon purpureus]|nr:hypothetical protein M758_1G017600 [Ceratodon purpureus]
MILWSIVLFLLTSITRVYPRTMIWGLTTSNRVGFISSDKHSYFYTSLPCLIS